MIIKGDVNTDGRITAEDALLVSMYVDGDISLSGDDLVAFRNAADIDKNGVINGNDVAALANHLLGIYMINEVL